MSERPFPFRACTAAIILKGLKMEVETHQPNTTTAQKLQELEKRNEAAFIGGGEDRVAKHKQGNRLTARERLDVLLDPGSFVEIDRFVTHRCENFGMGDQKIPGDGVITGYG